MAVPRSNVTYVSRLQCAQAAVAAQLDILKRTNPGRKIALVTFNNEVTVYNGETTTVFAGDRLNDYEKLMTAKDIPLKTADDVASALTDTVYSLKPTGATALGPALAVATAMAARVAGSKITIATDGLANVGLGSIEGTDESITSEEDDTVTESAAEVFYRRVATFAAGAGVSIDVVGIDGEGCNLETLSSLPDLTGGDLSSVKPENLANVFENAAAEPTLATNVVATVLLHKALEFRESGVEGTRVVRGLGNVRASTTVTFEYGMRRDAALAGGVAIPFQTQISFVRRDGSRVVRTITRVLRSTGDRRRAEAEMRQAVIATHAMQACGVEAKEKGMYHASRVTNAAYGRLMARNRRCEADERGYAMWSAQATALDSALAVEEAEERVAVGGVDEAAMPSSRVARMRKGRRGKKDALSAQLQKASRVSKAAFT